MGTGQEEKVRRLRERLQEVLSTEELPGYMKSDFVMARFLVGENWDLNAAASAYVNMIKWRREAEVFRISESVRDLPLKQSSLPHFEAVREAGDQGPWYQACSSRPDGHVVQLEVIGKANPSELFLKVPYQKIFEHYVGFFETRARILDEESSKKNAMIKTLQIRDLSQFGLHLIAHAQALSTLSALIKVGTTYYPECCEQAIFVNTPTSFYGVWSVIKPVLKEKTQKKVIHKLDFMVHAKSQDGHHDDFDPNEPVGYARNISVPARRSSEIFIYMTKGTRSKGTLRLQNYDSVPEASVLYHDEKGRLNEDQMTMSSTSKDNSFTYAFSYPEILSEDCLLCVKLSNHVSWIQALTVDYVVSFDKAN